jgi:hypothetical protein
MPPGHDLDVLARLFPALGLQQLVMTGELPDSRAACQLMDELVYPLATAPPTAPPPTRSLTKGHHPRE